MIEAYKEGLRSILESNGGDKIQEGLKAVVERLIKSWEGKNKELEISSDKEAIAAIKNFCGSLNSLKTINDFVNVYKENNQTSTVKVEDVKNGITDAVYSLLSVVLKGKLIDKKLLDDEIKEKQTDKPYRSQTRASKQRQAERLRRAFLDGTVETEEQKQARIKKQEEERAQRNKGAGFPVKQPDPNIETFSPQTERIWGNAMAAIEDRRHYSEFVNGAVGEKSIEKAISSAHAKKQSENWETASQRKFIVNQEYSYDADFRPAFKNLQGKINRSISFANRYNEKKKVWNETRKKYPAEMINAVFEKASEPDAKEKSYTPAEKEILRDFVGYKKARRNLRNRYTEIADFVIEKTKEYDRKRNGRKPFKEETKDKLVQDPETGMYILPQGTKRVYPNFLEMFARAFILPEFAHEDVRALQMKARKKKGMTDQQKTNLAFEIKDEFRELKRLLDSSEQAGYEGESRMAVQMTQTHSLGQGLWSEAFEMISRSGKTYYKWKEIIDKTVAGYAGYIKTVDKMFDYLAEVAAMFDFTTPKLDIEGHSAGDAHPLDLGGKNMERGSSIETY